MAPVPDRAERLAAEPEPPVARPQAVAPAPAPEAVPAGAGAERLARPAPPGRGAQAGRAATLLRLQVVLGNRAVQRLVQSPQAQAAPVPPVQRAEPGQEGAGGSAGAGSEAPVPAGEAGTGGSGGAGGTGGAPPAGASPEAAAQIAYAQAINQQVPPLSPEHTARLGAVIGDARVYGLIVERDTKKGQLQEWTTILQGHGTIPGKTVDELARMAGDLAAEIKRLDGEIKEQLPALGVADEAQLAERVERQFPELFVARARQIALVILDQNQTDVLRESNRYVVSQSTATGAPPPEVDGLRQADRELVPLAAELRPLAERLKGMTQEANQNVSGEELTALETDVRAKRVALETRLQAHGARYPILLRPDYNPGVYMDLPDEAVEQATGAATTRLLKNISDTRAGIEQDTIHVWDLNFVPELTYQSLNVPPGSPLRTAIARHAEGKRTAEALLSVALGVVAVGAGVALFSALGVGRRPSSWARPGAPGAASISCSRTSTPTCGRRRPGTWPSIHSSATCPRRSRSCCRSPSTWSSSGSTPARRPGRPGPCPAPPRSSGRPSPPGPTPSPSGLSSTAPAPPSPARRPRPWPSASPERGRCRRRPPGASSARAPGQRAKPPARAGRRGGRGGRRREAGCRLAGAAAGRSGPRHRALGEPRGCPAGHAAADPGRSGGAPRPADVRRDDPPPPRQVGRVPPRHHLHRRRGDHPRAVLHYIHEINHALWAHLGLSASQAKAMASLSRQEFIEAMIREEAIGQSKAIRAKFDLMRVGDFTATAALEEEYLEAGRRLPPGAPARAGGELRREMRAARRVRRLQAFYRRPPPPPGSGR